MSQAKAVSNGAIGAALGRIPSGLFILTVRHEERETGLLASWVQQAGFDPPALTVAVRKDRHVADWLDASRRFVLNQIAKGHKPLIRHFARGFDADAPAFDGVAISQRLAGGPVLAEALSWLEGEVLGDIASGDHRVFLARIVAGEVLHPDEEPTVHVRKDGFHY